jgi:hypothetical protein
MKMSSARFAGVSVLLVVSAVLTGGASGVEAGERWQWSITPYIWATDISEDLILDGAVVGGGDTEFSDLVDKIDSSLQLHFEGTRDRWGLFADINYVELSDSVTGEMGLGRLDVDIEESVFEVGAIYRPGGRSGRLDLLFGARMLAIDEDYRLQIGDLPPFGAEVDEDYLDALVGARYHIPLSQRWVISLRGDVSTGGTDYMWTAQGLIGWRFGANRNSGVFAGYRYRDMEYSKADVFEDKKTLSGFGLAVRFGF